MKLCYYNKEKNFGDELNELIFNHYLPGFFDNNEKILFMGIGTLLGMIKPGPKTEKILVFSSGLGAGDERTYGEMPELNEKYLIVCVRGPLTAKLLGLSEESAITDGALLLRGLDLPAVPKKYKWSYMPHHISEKLFPEWKKLVHEAGGHYISPGEGNPLNIIEQIRQSDLLISEAMHGAIVADIYRVPWIPVKSYQHVNDFKWSDWLSSLHMNYYPEILKSLFGKEKTESMLSDALPLKFKAGIKLLTYLYQFYQNTFKRQKVIKKIRQLSITEGYLSEQSLLDHYFKQLVLKIEFVKKLNHTITVNNAHSKIKYDGK
jgi:succinoglycan biosynthesis protein ExoV